MPQHFAQNPEWHLLMLLVNLQSGKGNQKTKRVYNLVAHKAGVPRVALASCQLERPISLFMNLYIARCLPLCHLMCDITGHFVFPGNTEKCLALVKFSKCFLR